MSNATKSVLVFGIYIVAVGLTLIFIPNVLLGLFGFAAATEVWIRVFGVLAGILGLYFIQAARERNLGFYRMTVWGRVIFTLSLIVLGLLTPSYRALILFGMVDLLGALWTGLALRQEANV